MLIETPEGIVNTAHIMSVREHDASPIGQQRTTITFADGSASVTRRYDLISEACGAIIPATPGFDVVTAILPGDGEVGIVYTFDVVIAFRIGAGWGDVEPVPITSTGRPDTITGAIWTLRQPNGRCGGPDGPHDDLDGFKANCEREVEKRARSRR